jgi:Flp pilus assembly protein TadG
MWRLTREDSERGAVAPLTAILLVAILGMTAFAVDVAMMYSEHSQLQNGADSSALAVAQACNEDSSSEECTAPDMAEVLANSNALDNATNIQNLVVDASAGTVDVTTQSRDTAGNNHFSLVFARALGIDTADIVASARARWGAPGAGPTLPWTFSWCVFEQALSAQQLSDLISTGDFTGDPSLTDVLIRYDTKAPSNTCNGPTGNAVPGGFGWLDQDPDAEPCTANVSTDDPAVGSDPGANFPNSCKAKLDALKTGPTLIPIFQETNGKSGNQAEYTIYGFAAFQATGWRFGGPALSWNNLTAPVCKPDCLGIKGHFVRFVSLEEAFTGSGPNLGGTTSRLTD